MAFDEWDGLAVAARLGRRRPGAFVCLPESLPLAVCGEQFAGLRADHAITIFPHAASADSPRFSPAARADDAQEPAAISPVLLAHRRIHRQLAAACAG